MNKVFKTLVLSMLLVLSNKQSSLSCKDPVILPSLLSSFSQGGQNSDLMPISCDQQQKVPGFTGSDDLNGSKGMDLGDFFDNFRQVLGDVSSLNYFESFSMIFKVPGLEQQLVYDWGFGGSGNLFIPLPTVDAKIDSIGPFKFGINLNENVFMGFGKVLLQDEILKRSKNLSFFKWLTLAKLTPIKLFVLKSILLLKETYQTGDVAMMKREIIRLLFRLSLVDDLKVIDKDKKFSSHYPSSIATVFEIVAPGMMDLIDEVWFFIIGNHEYNLTDFTNYLTVQGFAFQDKK